MSGTTLSTIKLASWVPPRETQAELDAIVLGSLRSFSIFCIGLYTVFAAAHWFLIPNQAVATTMGTVAAFSALFFGSGWQVLRKKRIPTRYGHPGAILFGSVVLANCLAHLYLTGQAEQSTNIALAIIGGGCFFLSLPWWGLYVTINLLGWFAVASALGPNFPLQHYAFGQLSAVFISGVVQILRLRTHKDLIEFRNRDSIRAHDLERALYQANISRRQTQLVIENAFDAVLPLAKDGSILDCNRPAERLLGLGRDRLVGASFLELVVAPEERPAVRDHLRELRAAAGETAEKRLFETVMVRGDSKRVPVEISLSETFSNGEVTATCCLRDITERHKALVAIEQASRAKSAFLATMSHELRTPLNAIIGYSEMVAEDLRESGAVKPAADLDKIHGAGKHLLSLVNDILDLSKIEAGKMILAPESFDAAERIRGAASTVAPLARKNGTTVEVHCEDNLGILHSDPLRFSQSLLNLASNACKFTRDGKVTIRGKRQTRGKVDWIVVEVEDTGVGLTADDISKLFEPYVQAGSEGRYGRAAGTGLGLVISRRFCRMMGGDIHVTSQVGKGSCFRIELPAIYEEPDMANLIHLAEALELKKPPRPN